MKRRQFLKWMGLAPSTPIIIKAVEKLEDSSLIKTSETHVFEPTMERSIGLDHTGMFSAIVERPLYKDNIKTYMISEIADIAFRHDKPTIYRRELNITFEGVPQFVVGEQASIDLSTVSYGKEGVFTGTVSHRTVDATHNSILESNYIITSLG